MPGYTHKQWATHAAAIGKALHEQLANAVSHIIGGLRARGGLRTTIADGQRVLVAISEVGAEGARLVAKYDSRFAGVHATQRQAGGVPEVAGDKWYNLAG